MDRRKWIKDALSAAIVLAVSCPASWAGGTTYENVSAAGLLASPSRTPMFGTVTGACQRRPSPCDNAWAGFCQEDLRWRQFWSRVGTGYWVPSRTMAPTCRIGAGTRTPWVPMFGVQGSSWHAVPPGAAPGTKHVAPGNDAGQAVDGEPARESGPLPPPPLPPPPVPPAPPPPAALDAIPEPPPLPDTPVSAPPDQAGVSEFRR